VLLFAHVLSTNRRIAPIPILRVAIDHVLTLKTQKSTPQSVIDVPMVEIPASSG
jgi:hypothetical protein